MKKEFFTKIVSSAFLLLFSTAAQAQFQSDSMH